MIINPLHIVSSVVAVTLVGLFFLEGGCIRRHWLRFRDNDGRLVLIFGGVSWFIVLVSLLISQVCLQSTSMKRRTLRVSFRIRVAYERGKT